MGADDDRTQQQLTPSQRSLQRLRRCMQLGGDASSVQLVQYAAEPPPRTTSRRSCVHLAEAMHGRLAQSNEALQKIYRLDCCGWLDGWLDGLMDGWMDGWVGGWMDGWMDIGWRRS